jgi:tetratricopeptide (TPR) repeat protein
MSERIVGGLISERNLVGVLVGMLQQGDLPTAIQLYEESGRAVAEQLFAQLTRSEQPVREAGVQMYVQARDFARAARLHESARFWPDAARLYEDAGDLPSAARCWKKAGELKRAAQALDAAGLVDEAALLYQELKQPAARGTALARGAKWLESARAYRDAGNLRAEADVLRQVPLDHPDRVPAVKRLAEILLQRNRPNEAAQVVADVLRDNEAGRTDLELHDLLAGLFDQLGQTAHAERLRLRADRLRKRAGVVAEPMSAPEARASTEEDGYRFLKEIPIFSRLGIDDMRDLYRLTREESWMPGQIVVEEGVDAPGLIIVIEGSAEVYAVGSEGVRHLNSVGAGAHLGEISLLSNSLTSARVTAATPVRALRISREEFEFFLQCHPQAALRIYRLFSEQLAQRVRALSLA